MFLLPVCTEGWSALFLFIYFLFTIYLFVMTKYSRLETKPSASFLHPWPDKASTLVWSRKKSSYVGGCEQWANYTVRWRLLTLPLRQVSCTWCSATTWSCWSLGPQPTYPWTKTPPSWVPSNWLNVTWLGDLVCYNDWISSSHHNLSVHLIATADRTLPLPCFLHSKCQLNFSWHLSAPIKKPCFPTEDDIIHKMLFLCRPPEEKDGEKSDNDNTAQRAIEMGKQEIKMRKKSLFLDWEKKLDKQMMWRGLLLLLNEFIMPDESPRGYSEIFSVGNSPLNIVLG